MNQIKTVCVYCGSGPGSNPRFVEAAIALGKVFRREQHPPRLWRRLGRPDGRGRQIHAGSWRLGHRHHSGFPAIARTYADARSGNDRHARHARAQAADVRTLRCVRRAARRHRHAGGTGRANDLAAARPSLQAGAARQHRQFLGTAAGAAVAYARQPSSSARRCRSRFSRPNGSRTSCRACAPPLRVRPKAPRKWRRKWRESFSRSAHHPVGNVTASMRLPSGSMTKAA